jgi:hypothetical protein
MATYLQGVQDYIPQFQPFQPDLNLYANVLQTKQTQYDSAWKSLNNVYGQYFYADLTRDNNIERKEEVLKNIDFNIKKVAGLDLSLEENIGKASKIFKPFYEDEYLMKDMAWTKNYNNQKGRAEGLKNSLDEKMREQYWDGGVRALDYMREEFKEVADQESLNFQNSSYTPYVNSVKKAQQIAKDAGLSIEAPPEFSEDGRWIIRKKNGEALMEPLSKLFEATLGNDPSIQAVYKTQAYLDRKDYGYSNAGQFGGDKNAAEMKYLEESYNQLKQENERRYKNLQSSSTAYQNKIAELETQIKNKKAGPDAEKYLEQLKEGKDINDKIIERIDKDNESMKEESGTPTTSSGFQNPYGDVKSLRWKVDNARASALMQKDLNEAAQIFAYKDAKTDIDANPYAVNEQKHAFSMQEIAARNKGLENAARIRNLGDAQNKASEHYVKSGVAEWDLEEFIQDENGNVVPNPNYMRHKMKDDALFQFTEKNVDGSTTDAVKKIDIARRDVKNATNEFAVPYLTNMVESIETLQKQGKLSKEDLGYIFEKFPGMSTKKMMNLIKTGSLNNFLLFTNDPWKAKDLAYRFQNVLNDNSHLDSFQKEIQKMQPYKNKFFDYTNYLSDQQKFFKEGAKEVETELRRQGVKYAEHLYDNKGRLRSKEEFEESIKKVGFKSQVLKRDMDVQIDGKWEKVTNQNLDQMIEKIGQSQLKLRGVYSGDQWARKGADLGKNNMKKDEWYVKDLSGKFIKVQKDNFAPAAKKLGEQQLFGTFGYNAPRTGEDSVGDLYRELTTSANSIWASPKVKAPLVGVTGEGAGQFQDKRNSMMVYPAGPGNLPGRRVTAQFAKDFRGIDFDGFNNGISFGGASKTAFEEIKGDQDKLGRGKALVNSIFAEMANSQSKMKQFKISSQNIAIGNANKGAMIITPDAEWLKTYMGKPDDDGLYAGLYTQTEYNDMLKNGITVIADSKLFNNDLFRSGTMSPLEAHIEYNKSYTEKSPYDKETSFTISKNNYGTGQYTIDSKYRSWNPNTNDWDVLTESISSGGAGFNLDQFRDELQQSFLKQAQMNTYLKNL